MDDGFVRAKIATPVQLLQSPVARVLAAAAIVVALVYLWRAVSAYGDRIAETAIIDAPLVVGIALGSVIYAASLVLLGLSWVSFLTPPPGQSRRYELLRVYALSAAVKYLPGGVFHFGGRQVGGAKLGISQKGLAAASVVEALASVAAALALAAAIYLFGLESLAVIFGAAAALCVAMKSGAAFANRIAAMTNVFLFMSIMAALAAGSGLAMRAPEESLSLVVCAYLAAWVVGFVIPGLSAGLGVREAAFVYFGSAAAATPELLAIALLMRLVTTIGDGLFSAAFLIGRRAASPPD